MLMVVNLSHRKFFPILNIRNFNLNIKLKIKNLISYRKILLNVRMYLNIFWVWLLLNFLGLRMQIIFYSKKLYVVLRRINILNIKDNKFRLYNLQNLQMYIGKIFISPHKKKYGVELRDIL